MDIRLLVALPLVVGTAADAQVGRPLTLDATLRRALESHPAIAASAERVRAARGSRLTARSLANPVLNYEVENEPVMELGAPGPITTDRKVSAFAMLPLEPLYQLPSRSSRASAEVRAAEADLREARRQLAIRAAEAFHRAANAQVEVETSRDVVSWLDSLVDYTRKRVREGATAEADLIRLEVERGRTETDLAMAEVELARANADLRGVLGMDSVTIDDSVDSIALGKALPGEAGLLALARRNRPDLKSVEAQVDAARAGVSIERSSIFREVEGMAGVMTMSGQRTFMGGVSMPLPLFDQNRGEIQRASAERRMAEFERANVERRVVAEVTSAYAAVRTLGEQVRRLSETLLRRAEEGRRIAGAAYREGAVPLVQVLDAARAHAEARMVYYRALFAWQQSVVELNAAIGSSELTTIPTGEVR